MKKLTGTDWGEDQQTLKKLFIDRVRPVMEYGIAAWTTTAEANMDRVKDIQNQAESIMTGAMKFTSIKT
jgi:hypothetical protein